MSVKIEDVARRAGVSTATVSLALNGSSKVSQKTRRRIEEIAREMNYHPNPSAKRLAMRRSRQIGLIVPDIENHYYSSLSQHILNALLPSDYTLLMSTSMNSRQMEKRIITDMIGNQVEGLLIAPVEKVNEDLSYLDMLERAAIPYIFVTSAYPGIPHPCVMCDLYQGMYRLLEHLHASGRRNVVMLSGTRDVYCFELRDRGYLDYVDHHALSRREIHHLRDVHYDDAYRFALTMDVKGVDAVVCVNDMMALGVINALEERQIRVPRDMAVAGFDDSIFSRVSPVSITTVRQDVGAMAQRATEQILRLVDGQPADPAADLHIPCEVILRRSTDHLQACHVKENADD